MGRSFPLTRCSHNAHVNAALEQVDDVRYHGVVLRTQWQASIYAIVLSAKLAVHVLYEVMTRKMSA